MRRTRLGARIAQIRSFHLQSGLPESYGWARGRCDTRDALLVQIITENGNEGWGEAAGPAALAQTAVHELFARELIGADITSPDVCWNKLWSSCQPYARRGSAIAALSALDIAMWDARGHLLGQSVSELLGGRYRDRIFCAAVGLYFREGPETERIPKLVEEARGYGDAGFRMVKIQLGQNTSHDLALIRALRAALPDAMLLAEAHGSFDYPDALAIGRALDDANFGAFEEPTSPETPDHARRLGLQIRTPVLTGRWAQTRWDATWSIGGGGGIGALLIDPTWCGGLTEAVKMRAVASGAGLNTLPRGGVTAIGQAAALHLLASDLRLPGRTEAAVGTLHRDGIADPLRDVLFSPNLPIEDGVARVPTTSGLGVKPDPDALRSFCLKEVCSQ